MSSGKKKRPLEKASQSGVVPPEKKMRIIGTQHAGEITPDVMAQLEQIQKEGTGLVAPNVPVNKADAEKPALRKKSKVMVTSIQETKDVEPVAEIEIPEEEALVEDFEEAEPELEAPLEHVIEQPTIKEIKKQGSDSIPLSKPIVRKPKVQPASVISHRAFDVPLPSKGVLYGGPYSNGMIQVRPMTTKEESILYSDGDSLSQLNKILNRCVQNPEMELMDLLLQDRFAILIYLRTHSYGSKYDIPFVCSGCGYKKTITIDLLNELSLKTMDDDSEEPFEVDLPVSGHFIHFRLLRGTDEETISKKVKRFMLKSMDEGDPSNIYRLALAIMGVDGVEMPSFEQRVKFVEELLPVDSHALRTAVEDVEGKIDTTVYHECPSCKLTNEFGMPFTAKFFRTSRQ